MLNENWFDGRSCPGHGAQPRGWPPFVLDGAPAPDFGLLALQQAGQSMRAAATLSAEECHMLYVAGFLRYPADTCVRYNACEVISPASKSPWKFFFASSISGLHIFLFKQNLRF
jgi:hypothetical protein